MSYKARRKKGDMGLSSVAVLWAELRFSRLLCERFSPPVKYASVLKRDVRDEHSCQYVAQTFSGGFCEKASRRLETTTSRLKLHALGEHTCACGANSLLGASV